MVRRLGETRYDRRVRAIVLVAMGISLVTWGWGYLSPSWVPTPNMMILDAAVPIRFWAIIWIGAGLGCLAGIFFPYLARLSMATGASMWATWFISYCVAWVVFDGASRAWVPAAPFGLLAVMMFVFTLLMEPSSAVRGKHDLVTRRQRKEK